MSNNTILIVEDEEAIRIGLVDVFVYRGYKVEFAEDGAVGLEMALSGKFDLILLDVMLPSIDGFTICQKIREQDKEQPIIMLTAKTADEDIINGLTLGADDYVAKPFSITQLLLRVKAVLRRSGLAEAKTSQIRLHQNRIVDLLNLCVQVDNNSVPFTRKEIQVIEYLNQHKDRPVNREELLSHIWGYDPEMEIETRTIDIHIARIRRKIEVDHKAPQFLVTIRGAGYKLITSDE